MRPRTHCLGGDPDGAAALGRQAVALVDAQTEPLLAGMAHDRLARYLWDTTDQSDAWGIQQRAVALVPADPPSAERAHVLAGLGGHLMVLGRYQEARRVTEEAMRDRAERRRLLRRGAVRQRQRVGRRLQQPAFVSDVEEALDITGLEPAHLVLEVAGTAWFDRPVG